MTGFGDRDRFQLTSIAPMRRYSYTGSNKKRAREGRSPHFAETGT